MDDAQMVSRAVETLYVIVTVDGISYRFVHHWNAQWQK